MHVVWVSLSQTDMRVPNFSRLLREVGIDATPGNPLFGEAENRRASPPLWYKCFHIWLLDQLLHRENRLIGRPKELMLP